MAARVRDLRIRRRSRIRTVGCRKRWSGPTVEVIKSIYLLVKHVGFKLLRLPPLRRCRRPGVPAGRSANPRPCERSAVADDVAREGIYKKAPQCIV